MANSYVRYTGNGATTNFSLTFPYIDQDHVVVLVDGEEETFSWVNSTTVSISPAPANGAVVELRRITPADARIVDFQNGSLVTEEELDNSALQNFYLAQESADGANDSLGLDDLAQEWDAESRKITNVDDPTDDQDAATKAYVDSVLAADQAAAAAASASAASASASAASSSASAASVSAASAAASAAAASGLWETGDLKHTTKSTASSGWLFCGGKTIGNASSGATARANADTSALFTHLWNTFANSICAVSGGRGASAAADFAANKTIALLDFRGRTLAGLDTMDGSAASRLTSAASGVDGATLGASGGTQTHTLITAEMPSHGHNVTDPGHIHTMDGGSNPAIGTTRGTFGDGSNLGDMFTDSASTGISIQNTGGGGAHNNTQPTSVVNIVIKL